MVPEDVMKEISIKNDAKIILLVMDGVGGAGGPHGKTELEEASTPNLDNLAKESVCGVSDPISYGITPGSGPSHVALFGYDPLKYEIGRGVLEALGINMKLGKDDLAARGNFATQDNKGVITDRRAGRIPTEKNKELCKMLQDGIKEVKDVKVIIEPGKEHRFVVVFRGKGLSGGINDTDPQKEGKKPIIPPQETRPEAKNAANIINRFIITANDILKDSKPANTVLLRGIAKVPDIPSMEELFKLTPAAIATYPMYKGLARLVGMEILEAGVTIEDEIETLKKNYNRFDFFYIHVKKTDSYGEDGNFKEKVKIIEETDRNLPKILDLKPDVLVVTGDHSTPSMLKAHSWHPNPFMLYSRNIRRDEIARFTEIECIKGGLGRFPAKESMSLMLAHALKLEKYGA